ncbi:putative SKI-interacting protein, SKIP [Helianthus debilis subsp. tardiflorus]
MAALKEILPPAKSSAATFYDHSSDPWFKQRYSASTEEEVANVVKTNPIPLYNTPERLKYRPSKPQDFGDGGAFPEIHYAQYPLDMGRKRDSNSGPKTLPVTVDDKGNLTFDAIVKQNENSRKIVYSQHRDIIPKILKDDEEEYEEDDEKQIIRMVEMPVDPLEPPKFKHKRVPKANGSPPVPVMHSPPRPVTVKDQQDWKIPPCISNWKNPKGYTIPLDKRLAADGRGLQEVQINDNFAKLSEALYVAEQQAREAVSMRSKVQKEMMMKEKERKEQELRALAQKARSERTGTRPAIGAGPGSFAPDMSMMDTDEPMRPEHEHDREHERKHKRGSDRDRDRDQPRETKEEREERIQREKIREERRRERERERRLEAKDAAMGKKSKITRDRDRDISEKVALGMASAGSGRGGEVMYDQRLFNQEKGMESGFATDDQYNIYDKGLFTAQPTLSTLYRPKKDADDEMYGGADEQLEKIRKTDRFKPDKGFTGAGEKSGPRGGPVEFERDVVEDADPFGLDQFLTEVKGGKKPLDKIGSGGTMRASGGGSRDGYEGSGRTRIGFEKGR